MPTLSRSHLLAAASAALVLLIAGTAAMIQHRRAERMLPAALRSLEAEAVADLAVARGLAHDPPRGLDPVIAATTLRGLAFQGTPRPGTDPFGPLTLHVTIGPLDAATVPAGEVSLSDWRDDYGNRAGAVGRDSAIRVLTAIAWDPAQQALDRLSQADSIDWLALYKRPLPESADWATLPSLPMDRLVALLDAQVGKAELEWTAIRKRQAERTLRRALQVASLVAEHSRTSAEVAPMGAVSGRLLDALQSFLEQDRRGAEADSIRSYRADAFTSVSETLRELDGFGVVAGAAAVATDSVLPGGVRHDARAAVVRAEGCGGVLAAMPEVHATEAALGHERLMARWARRCD